MLACLKSPQYDAVLAIQRLAGRSRWAGGKSFVSAGRRGGLSLFTTLDFQRVFPKSVSACLTMDGVYDFNCRKQRAPGPGRPAREPLGHRPRLTAALPCAAAAQGGAGELATRPRLRPWRFAQTSPASLMVDARWRARHLGPALLGDAP